MPPVRSVTLFGLVAALAAAQPSFAAITVGTRAAAPALRVDANGNAEVSWSAGGRRTTLLVPATGRLLPGHALAGKDVSETVRGTHIPFQRVLRYAPGGWYYALQAWRPDPKGPVELRFSRWQGVPTEVSLTAKKTSRGVKLTGRVTVDEKAAPTRWRPRGWGAVQQGHVFLDALRGNRWQRLRDSRLASGASFGAIVAESALVSSYRATVLGPNFGTTYAPDASAVVGPPIESDLPPRRHGG